MISSVITMCCFSTIIWREEEIGRLVNLSSIKMKYMFFGLSKTNTRWKIFPSEKVAQSWTAFIVPVFRKRLKQTVRAWKKT